MKTEQDKNIPYKTYLDESELAMNLSSRNLIMIQLILIFLQRFLIFTRCIAHHHL